MMENLKARESAFEKIYAIKAINGGYTLTQQREYYSDSTNPKGEYTTYEDKIKTYKTINGAIKGLRKRIECHFPKGYNIDELINTIALRQ